MKTAPMNTAPKTLTALAAAALLLAGVGALTPRPAHADPTDGERYAAVQIPHGDDEYYHIKYNGGQEADFHAAATDDNDNQFLEIKVYDPDGNLVTRSYGTAGDAGDDGSPVCRWVVDSQWAWRQYTVKVVNLSYHDITCGVHIF